MARLGVGEKRLVTLEGLRAESAALWHDVPRGSVVWLTGDLGTGKTTFVQALAEVAGAEAARSPTFSLVHEYEASDGFLFHVDCYRLRAPDEALDLDFPEILRRARLLLVEWPDRAGYLAPPPDISLVFSHCDDPAVRLLERVR
ncbi:tRNA (adenosine(37)-N6)-threonylcarbamoyltransferase complex ATPase subunit type 1 TsaE [Gemmatimonadota bacterium]